GVAVDVDQDRPMLDHRFAHDRAGALATDDRAAVTGDDLEGAAVGTEPDALPIRLARPGVAFAVIQNHSFGYGWRGVGAVHQHGALVDMRVTAEHQVHAAGFQDGHDVGAHLAQLGLAVAIVRALGIGRVMEKGDDPVGFG